MVSGAFCFFCEHPVALKFSPGRMEVEKRGESGLPEGGRGKVGDKGERWEGVCPIRRVAEEGASQTEWHLQYVEVKGRK